jgi:hypothetical protein
MRTAARLGAILTLGVVASCGTPAASSAGLASTVAQTAGPTGSPASSVAAARTFPPSQTPIAPGRYRWSRVAPAVSFDVGPGWELGHAHPEFFDLFRGSDFPSVSFARFTSVHSDATTQVPATDAQTVVAALSARSDVTLSGAEAVTLGGLSGTRFDLSVASPQTPLFMGPAGAFKMDPGFVNRYRVLDLPGGGVLVIGVHVRGDGIEAASGLAEPIFASFAVDP